MIVMRKLCARCDQLVRLPSFRPEPRMMTGLTSYCKPCRSAHTKELYHKNPERSRALNRERMQRNYSPVKRRVQVMQMLYGVTPDQYAGLLLAQDGRCAICATGTPGGRGNWHVDHDHDSGKVRGLLCTNCNVGLGMFKDDIERMRAAIAYLDKHA